MPKKKINKWVLMPRKAVLFLVKSYQKTLSPDHGFFSYKYPHGYCKHFPSCSEYSYQAVEKYGVIKGGIKSAARIVKCNPYSQGGYDPLDLTK